MEGIFDFVSGLCSGMTGPAVNGLLVGFVVTGLSWLIWLFMHRTNATTRYATWWTTLVLVLLLPLLLSLEFGNILEQDDKDYHGD